jgi:nucleoside-diphosphate-sugar epimerase
VSTGAARTRASKPSLLIVGCGDVGLRVMKQVLPRWRVLALSSSPARLAELRAAGAVPLLGNLDEPATLARLGSLADHVLHLAPPPSQGRADPRTGHLLQALALGGRVKRLVYGSTTGVYGNCHGEWIDETRPVQPQTDRAQRRVDAEAQLRAFGRRTGVAVTILRIPGIYALDRDGGDPRSRVARGQPVLRADDDVYTNHVHADDLARACWRALVVGMPQRVVNVCDDSDLAMGDHYDRVADLCGLPRPARLPATELKAQVTPMTWSFMAESRRIGNARLKRELGLRLRYPDVSAALAGLRPDLAGA